MLLFLDTETTGLWDFNRPWDWYTQPDILQLGMLLCHDDEYCTQVASLNEIIKPAPQRNWDVKAENIHHISLEYATAIGKPLEQVVDSAINLMRDADEDGMGGRIIAHNIQFDTNVMMRAMALCECNPTPYSILRPFCTMRALTTRMNLPSKNRKPKWPTLDEAYAYCCPNILLDESARHSAMGDLLMCRDIFIAGRNKGWWS